MSSITTPPVILQQQLPSLNGKKPNPHWVKLARKTSISNVLQYKEHGPFFYLRLVTNEADYLRISGETTDFTVPAFPAPVNHATTTSAVQVAKDDSTFKVNHAKALRYQEVESALKNSYISAVGPEYLATLEHADLGFSHVSVLDIMEHLQAHYGTVSTAQLSDNELQMRKTWNLPSTIESLWKQLDDGKNFASGSAVPIDDARVVLYAKELLLATGVTEFKKAIETFEALTTNEQTWVKFKKDLTDEYNKLPLTLTSSTAGYHANQVTDPPSDASDFLYCWTHGLKFGRAAHRGTGCNNKAPGHIDTATVFNMQGGNNYIQRQPNETQVYRHRPNNNRNRNNRNAAPEATPAQV